MSKLDGLFTFESLLSLQGAAAATLLIPNVLRYLFGVGFQPYEKWVAFVIAMGLSLLVAGLAKETTWTKWFVACFNGFLVFASAVGINQVAVAAAPATETANQFFRTWL
jgi:ABC-type multidrug transport system permease subunit